MSSKEIELLDAARDEDKAKLRQVQFGGRRYAISIEPIYWDCLEEAAAELDIRLNALVAAVAGSDSGPKNLAARLRLFSIRRMRRLHRRAENLSQGADMVGLIDAVQGPCFAITPTREIAHANRPLHELVGEQPGTMAGEPSDKYFRIRFVDDPEDPDVQTVATRTKLLAGSLALMVPGRLAARRFVACPVPLGHKNQYLLVIFIK